MNKPIFIFTGLSGAGKSTALQVMQDMGFFTADGIAPSLIYDFYQSLQKPEMSHFQGIAFGIDVWRGANIQNIQDSLAILKLQKIPTTLIFLEASEDSIIRRYATTRRPHPFASQGQALQEAIQEELNSNLAIRKLADLIIDTSQLNLHDLRRSLQNKFSLSINKAHNLEIELLSFGYKYAIPKEADLVFDLRFLINPYFEPKLKDLNGLDLAVANYILEDKHTQNFLQTFLNFLYFLLPFYQTEGRFKLCIALGCTGGQHRSVTITEYLDKELKQHGYKTTKLHKELNRKK